MGICVRSKYLGQAYVITSHSILWNLITYPCPKYLILALKSLQTEMIFVLEYLWFSSTQHQIIFYHCLVQRICILYNLACLVPVDIVKWYSPLNICDFHRHYNSAIYLFLATFEGNRLHNTTTNVFLLWFICNKLVASHLMDESNWSHCIMRHLIPAPVGWYYFYHN